MKTVRFSYIISKSSYYHSRNSNSIFVVLHIDLLYGQLISPDFKTSAAGVAASSAKTSTIKDTRSHTSAAVGAAKASEVTCSYIPTN